MTYLIDYLITLKSLCLFKVLFSDEVRERIKMIYVGELDIKAAFLDILAVVSEEERLRNFKVNNHFFFMTRIKISMYYLNT